MKFIKALGLGLSLIPVHSLAVEAHKQNVETKIDAPKDEFLGLKIDASTIEELAPKDLVIDLNQKEKVKLNKTDMDITVFKGKDGINRIKALIGFDFYFDNDQQSKNNYVYVQCPVQENKQVMIEEPMTFVRNGKEYKTTGYRLETLSEKVVDRGFYSFDFESNIKNPIKVEINSIPIEQELIALRFEYLCAAFGKKLAVDKLKQQHKDFYMKRFEQGN